MIYDDIKISLLKIVKECFPQHKRFSEDIVKLNDEIKKNKIKNYIFLQLIPIENNALGVFTDRNILVSIQLHDEETSYHKYYEDAEQLEAALFPSFSFGERSIKVARTTANIVDDVLNFTFTLSFKDTFAEDPDDEEIQESILEM